MTEPATRTRHRYLRSDHLSIGPRYGTAVLIAGALLSAAALIGVAWAAGWSDVAHGLLHANWPWLALAPVGVGVSHLGYTLCYREVACLGPGPDLAAEEAVAMVTTGFGPFSARGGFAMDASAFRNLGLSEREARLRVHTLGMLEYVILAPVTLASACYMLVAGQPAQDGLLPSWVIGVPAGSAAAIALILAFRRKGRPKTWWRPLREMVEAAEETLKLLKNWPANLLALAGITLYWAADICALAACMGVFTHRHGVGPALVVGYATGYALTRRTLPLAGAGVVEALLPFAVYWVGYPFATAVLAVIAYRLFNLWLAVLPAVMGLRHLRRDRPDPTNP